MTLAKKLLSCAAIFALTACGGGLGQALPDGWQQYLNK